ncbi:MAG: alpha/beta hydrolase [Ruminococcaceae bacterium]|jgi:alpha-beta hydrolase superfamily lysophospholipase|nr:alpha/beta hydrolase [Oscillospiraceae bacterium]
MPNRKEFYFPSSDGITKIHAIEWTPEGEPKGVYQIAHGVAEYALRYEPFAEFLTGKGFVVVANDHIGHGLSVAEGAAPLYFGEKDGWTHVVDDMYALRNLSSQKYPGVPYFLMGHSMGSFLARTFLIRYPGKVHAAVIMGTGQQPGFMVAGGKLAAAVFGKKGGFDKFNATVDNLAFGAYNKPFEPKRTSFDWLSANTENVDRYIADPLCGGQTTVGLFRDMLGGIGFISKASNLAKMDKNTPVLFISGAMDPVGDLGKGTTKAYESFKKAGVRDVSLKLYPGLRHEILNEKEADQVRADIWAWVEAHM